MNEQNKKQIIMVGVLAVLLVGVLVYQFVLVGDPPPATSSTKQDTNPAATRKTTVLPSANMQETEEVDIEELIQSVEVQPIDYSAVRINRNPMAPLVGIIEIDPSGGSTASGAEIKHVGRRKREVTGIIWDSVRPVAIIDNMVVHEGYVFADGVVVQEIEPTRVLLKIGETIRPLEMKEF
ncbi:MAG: hypothetical protein KAH38_02995 [Candidatus Hydrogenedentes bacterium]|nr:hypothetical protein [Candidatus Hydrogenedentota bacterium]